MSYNQAVCDGRGEKVAVDNVLGFNMTSEIVLCMSACCWNHSLTNVHMPRDIKKRSAQILKE